MKFILSLLGGSVGPYIAGAVGALVLGLSLSLWLALSALSGARSDAATYKGLFGQEHQSFLLEKAHGDRLGAARTSDHSDAVTDANATQTACDARVASARRSASAITQLLNDPPHEKLDPAEPELFTADQLRHAQGR